MANRHQNGPDRPSVDPTTRLWRPKFTELALKVIFHKLFGVKNIASTFQPQRACEKLD